jgi:hypothetical protein
VCSSDLVKRGKELAGASTMIDFSTQPRDDEDVTLAVTADMNVSLSTMVAASKLVDDNKFDNFDNIDLGGTDVIKIENESQ